MKTPYSVAIYTGESSSTTFIERLIGALASDGVPVYIFGIDNGRPHNSGNIKYFTVKGKPGQLWILIKYSFLLWIRKRKQKNLLDAYIRKQSKNRFRLRLKYYPVLYHKPDIFHIQWAKGLKDWVWVKQFGIKLVLSFRGAHINYSPLVDEELANEYRTFFPEVDAFHAVSEAIKKESAKYMASTDKVSVIKSGLKLDDFPFQKKNFSPTPLKILAVGRNHWKKDYSTALDAMAVLNGTDTPFHFTIAGVGKDEALNFQRRQLDLVDSVSFKPFLSFDEIRELISQADVLLLSSVEEGIANVVLEAMALGTLVLSTDCGGMKEVINHGENGYIIPMRDPKALAAALQSISELSAKDYEHITLKARGFIEENHSELLMLKGFRRLYDNLNPLKL